MTATVDEEDLVHVRHQLPREVDIGVEDELRYPGAASMATAASISSG